MPVDPELLEILACPDCKTPVTLVKNGAALKCEQCKRVYPIKDDIPVMLIDEATDRAVALSASMQHSCWSGFGMIGDVVFTTPAIRALRRRFPDAQITYLVEAAAAPVVRRQSRISTT